MEIDRAVGVLEGRAATMLAPNEVFDELVDASNRRHVPTLMEQTAVAQ